MGKITHADVGIELSAAEWVANTTHKDDQNNTLELSRSSTGVVAANNAASKSIAGADEVGDGTADNVEIQSVIDGLP